jgi:hypothetical protein
MKSVEEMKRLQKRMRREGELDAARGALKANLRVSAYALLQAAEGVGHSAVMYNVKTRAVVRSQLHEALCAAQDVIEKRWPEVEAELIKFVAEMRKEQAEDA